MQKTDISESCNATSSALGHEYEENEDEDSDVYYLNNTSCVCDISSEDDGSFFSEDSEESELDGDEPKEPWMPEDKDEDGYQDLDMYEADCEDQDTDTDSDEEDHQNTNPSGDEDKASNSKPAKESAQDTPLDKDSLHKPTPTSPQVSKPDPSPTPEPHHETIALGQHHLWMM